MWSSETLATLMSMISISVGSITVTATIHLLPRIASTALSNRLSPFIGLPDVHRGHDGHPDPQHVLRVFPPVEHDLHRDPLHAMMLSTFPWYFFPANVSMRMVTGWPGRIFSIWVSL